MKPKLISFFLFVIFLSCDSNRRETTNSENTIEKIKLEADSFYYENNYSRAIILFNELIALDSTKGEYYFKRGFSYSMLLNAEQAIKDYSKAAELEYRKADAYKNIGINYSTINDSLAIYYLDKCLEIEPENAKAKRIKEECESRLKLQ